MVGSFGGNLGNIASQAQSAVSEANSLISSAQSALTSIGGSLAGAAGAITGKGGSGGPAGDPFTRMRFWVEVENEVKAAFAVMQGLSVEIPVSDHSNGGDNSTTHKLVTGSAKYTNLILKQGLTTDDFFWKWIDQVRNGKVTRRTVTIIITSTDGAQKVSWSFLRAFPVKWIGPQLQADSSEIALQTLEFVHEGLQKN
jgi:phage tail-like protein